MTERALQLSGRCSGRDSTPLGSPTPFISPGDKCRGQRGPYSSPGDAAAGIPSWCGSYTFSSAHAKSIGLQRGPCSSHQLQWQGPHPGINTPFSPAHARSVGFRRGPHSSLKGATAGGHGTGENGDHRLELAGGRRWPGRSFRFQSTLLSTASGYQCFRGSLSIFARAASGVVGTLLLAGRASFCFGLRGQKVVTLVRSS